MNSLDVGLLGGKWPKSGDFPCPFSVWCVCVSWYPIHSERQPTRSGVQQYVDASAAVTQDESQVSNTGGGGREGSCITLVPYLTSKFILLSPATRGEHQSLIL